MTHYRTSGLRLREVAMTESVQQSPLDNVCITLSDADLIAGLLDLDSTPAEQLLDTVGGLRMLANCPPLVLQQWAGIGPKRAPKLQLAIEFARRLHARRGEPVQITSPADAGRLLQPRMATLEQEHFVAIMLNTKNHVLKIHTVYIGNVNAIGVRCSELFREAVRLNAVAMIVAHNHPSSDPEPSSEDVAVTRTLVQAARILDIDLLDHLIITPGRVVSLRERGLGF